MAMIQRLANILKGSRTSQKVSLRDRSGGEYPRLGYDNEDAAARAVKIVDGNSMTSYQRLVTLWNQVRWLDENNVAGALVECGSWRGGSSAMMALAHQAAGTPKRNLHVFDSFEGLPEPDAAVDGAQSVGYAGGNAAGTLTTIGKCVGTLDENKALILGKVGYPEALAHFHVGWFQDTLPKDAAAIGPIALLRLDGDWYDSTKVCLDHLYDRLVPGGIMVIDDYGHWEGCRKAVDEFFAARGERPMLHHIDKTARYIQA